MPRTKRLLIERTAAITGGDKATGHQQTDLSTNDQSGKRVERGNKWFNFVESNWKPKLAHVFWLKRAWATSEITHSKIKQTKPCTEVRKVATLGSGSDQKAAPGASVVQVMWCFWIMVITQVCSVLKNSSVCTLMIFALFCMYIILQYKKFQSSLAGLKLSIIWLTKNVTKRTKMSRQDS